MPPPPPLSLPRPSPPLRAYRRPCRVLLRLPRPVPASLRPRRPCRPRRAFKPLSHPLVPANLLLRPLSRHPRVFQRQSRPQALPSPSRPLSSRKSPPRAPAFRLLSPRLANRRVWLLLSPRLRARAFPHPSHRLASLPALLRHPHLHPCTPQLRAPASSLLSPRRANRPALRPHLRVLRLPLHSKPLRARVYLRRSPRLPLALRPPPMPLFRPASPRPSLHTRRLLPTPLLRPSRPSFPLLPLRLSPRLGSVPVPEVP